MYAGVEDEEENELFPSSASNIFSFMFQEEPSLGERHLQSCYYENYSRVMIT